MNYTILNYLFGHPILFLGLIVAAVILVVLWLASPVSWRDGEGSVSRSGDETASWLRGFFGLFKL